MFIPPLGVYKISYQPSGGTSLGPVPQREWSRFCNEGDAAVLASEINANGALGLKMGPNPYVDPEEPLGYVIANQSQAIRMWSLTGMMSDGVTPFYVAPAGSFLDRRTYPDPFLDRNPDTSLGGPNMVMKNMGGVFVLCWGK